MKNIKLVLLILFGFSSLSLAQQGAGYNYLRLAPTSLPAKCQPGDIRVQSGSSTLQVCYPANNWNQTVTIGAGSGLSATAGGLLYGNGTGLLNTGAGTSGYFLQSNGAAAPSFVQNPSVTQNYWSGYAPGAASWNSVASSLTTMTYVSGSTTVTTRISGGTFATTPPVAWSTQPAILFTPASSTAVYEVSASFTLRNAPSYVSSMGLTGNAGSSFISQATQQNGTNGANNIVLHGFFAPGSTTAQILNIYVGSSDAGNETITQVDTLSQSSIEWSLLQIK